MHSANHYFFRRLITLAISLSALLASSGDLKADFIGNKEQTLNGSGAWWTNTFTVYSTTTFTLYFTAQYKATAVVANQNQLSAFQNGSSVSYLAGLDNSFGLRSVTLSPGSYFVGVRNNVSGANKISVELEMHPLQIDGYTYIGTEIEGVEYVNAGGWLTHDFTIDNGRRYVIEGCNTGSLEVYIIPRSEKTNFQNDSGFQYYTEYFESDGDAPGLHNPISLAPGSYTLAVRSNSGIQEAITYRIYEYQESNPAHGIYYEWAEYYYDYFNYLRYYNAANAYYYLYYYIYLAEDAKYYGDLGNYYYYYYYAYGYYYYFTTLGSGSNLANYYFYYYAALGWYYHYVADGNSPAAAYYYNYQFAYAIWYYYAHYGNYSLANYYFSYYISLL